tara:strand:+ start:2449 stop:3282 length:834 start_codon:yes stop_codon:yes gene_type:complete
MTKKYSYFFILLCITKLFSESNNKLITIGGSITEIAFSLGLENNIIAVDISSTLPPKVKKLPQIGYIRHISAEGILSMEPHKIITTSEMGPPNVIEQIQNTGIELIIYDSPSNYNDVLKLIKKMSNSFNIVEKGDEIILKLSKEYKFIQDKISLLKNKKKFVFFMDSRNTGVFNVAGGNTRANYLIELIGGENIFKNEFNKYKKVSSENILSLNPEIILIGSMTNESILKKQLLNDKNLKLVDAIKTNKIFIIDIGYYLTFGTNITKAAIDLLKIVK